MKFEAIFVKKPITQSKKNQGYKKPNLYLCNMVKEMQFRLSLKESKDEQILKRKVAHYLSVLEKDITAIKILRKSIDARKPKIIVNYKLQVFINEEVPKEKNYIFDYKDVSNAKEIHIIGFGPAGMYAALRCLELGYKPIVLERGKNVKDRRRDLKAINQDHFVNEDSNYCFGEGGAGTYSDGKLYTRSLKRGDVRKIFENLVYHGATEQILVDAHPHIGTRLSGQYQFAADLSARGAWCLGGTD